MPADIITRLDTTDAAPAITVETKASLDPSVAWTAQPHVYANRLTTNVNGADRCDLVFETGAAVRQFGETGFAAHDPLDLVGQFVRVTVATTPQLVWHGVITADSTARRAVIDDNGTNRLVGGQQTLTAQGLEYLLSRTQVTSTVIYTGGAPVRLLRPRGFNTGSIAPAEGEWQRGNRHTLYDNNLPVFEDGSILSAEWDAGEMIEHLLAFHAPETDTGDPSPVRWTIDPAFNTALTSYKPSVRTEGRTLLDLVNTLANPRRGFCWWLDFDPTGDNDNGLITLYGDTTTPDALTLTAGGAVPANSRQLSLDFDDDPRVAQATVAKQDQQRYSRFIVRGARMTSTFTVGPQAGDLAEDWSAAQETAIKAGAGGTDAAANDAARRAPLLDRVYAAFRIPAGWDRKSSDGKSAAAGERDWVFPELSPSGSVLGSLPVQTQGVRLLRSTRLQKGVDYREPDNLTDNNPPGSAVEYEPPFAIVQVATSPDGYQLADRLNDASPGGTPVTSGSLASYHLYPQPNTPGVVLRSSAGKQHTLAKNHWAGAAATGTEPQLDYETLRLTVTAEADAYCEGVWPLTVPAGERVDTLVIDAGEDYRLDFLAARTVVGLENGTPVTASENARLADDREQLADLAELAFQWYQQPRQTLSLRFKRSARWQTDGNLPLAPGVMITTIGDGATQETINTVVGRVAWDFQRWTTEVETIPNNVSLPELIS